MKTQKNYKLRKISLMSALSALVMSSVAYANESGVYDHLMSDTFYYKNGNTKWGEKFESIAKTFLEVILPFMAIFGITNITLSMSATVIYLSRPDFFDKIHILKYLKRKKKGEGGKAFEKINRIIKDLGLSGFFMATFIPDFKALAFYDAAELGEDGRPSVTTFLKTSFPKYAAILALIIMISDGTLMNVNLKAAEVARWFFKKTESYDYIYTLEKYSQQGKKYKVPYKGGKKKIFNTVYDTALSLDDSITATSQTYREQVGSKVDTWVNSNFKDSDFEGTIVAAKARATTVPVIEGESKNDGGNRIYQVPVSQFGVTPTGDAKYIVLETTFQTKENLIANPTYTTTSPEAWSGDAGNLTLDITKIPELLNASDAEIIGEATIDPRGGSNVKFDQTHTKTTYTFTTGNTDYDAVSVRIKVKANGQVLDIPKTWANPNKGSGKTEP